MNAPLVSVVLPFFRDKLVVEAVDSILNQTFRDIELIAIDDGSDNGVSDLLRHIRDPRFQLVTRPRNGGAGAARNDGVGLARGRYIAFQDGDDISYPDRLRKQLETLHRNPRLVGCGCACHYGEGKDEHFVPTHPVDLRWEMIFNSYVVFPTVMVRAEIAKRVEFTRMSAAQDYLWLYHVMESGDFLNLPDLLFHYRMQPTSLSKLRAQAQITNGNRCRGLFAANTGIHCDDREIELLEWLGWPRQEPWPSVAKLEEAAILLRRLYGGFVERYPERRRQIRKAAAARLRLATTLSAELGPGAYRAFRSLTRSSLGMSHDPLLLAKCILRSSTRSIRRRAR